MTKTIITEAMTGVPAGDNIPETPPNRSQIRSTSAGIQMKKIALLFPVIAGVLFGSAGIFVRTLSANGMNNPTVLFLRTVFALLEMLLFILIYNRRLLRINIRHLPIFLGTGLLGMLGLNLCYNEAINSLTLSLAAILLGTAPIFVMILAAIIFKERITRKKLLCMLVVIVGCILASGLLEQQSGINFSALGVISGVGAALFYALYSIFSRFATDKKYHTYTVIFYSVLVASVVLVPFTDFSAIGGFVSAKPAENIGFLLLHSLCTSVLPYILLTLALLYAEAGKVSILASGGEPIAAVIFGILFYSEVPSVPMLVGLAVVIAGLAFLCAGKKPTEKAR